MSCSAARAHDPVTNLRKAPYMRLACRQRAEPTERVRREPIVSCDDVREQRHYTELAAITPDVARLTWTSIWLLPVIDLAIYGINDAVAVPAYDGVSVIS